MRDRLTILIINIAFAFRSGTEIVVDQIARGLNRRGHRPIVFAPYVGGGLTAGLRLSGIAVVDRLNQVGCTPDVIHGQHNVTTVMAMAAFPRTPALFSCHDFEAPKDRAPLLPRIRRYIAVDDCCRERLVRDGAPQDRIDVVYNAVDLDQYRHRGPLPRRAERALVLTKGSEHLATVRSAAATAGLALDELSVGNNHAAVRAESSQVFPKTFGGKLMIAQHSVVEIEVQADERLRRDCFRTAACCEQQRAHGGVGRRVTAKLVRDQTPWRTALLLNRRTLPAAAPT